MGAFDHTPDPLPVEPNPSRLPLKYSLKVDKADPYAAIMFYVAGILLFVFLAYKFTNPLGSYENQSDKYVVIAGLFVMIGTIWFFGRKIASQLRIAKTHLEVIISNGNVSVTSLPDAEKNFSSPLSSYGGLVLEDRGTELIDGTKQKIVALILWHSDEKKTLPLAITANDRLGKKKVNKYARLLGLKILPYKYAVSLQSALPEGTILANAGKSSRLKYLTWFLCLASLALVATAVFIFNSWGLAQFDGGVLKPLGQRLLLAGILTALAVLIVGGIYYYNHLYLVSMQQKGNKLHLTTFWGKPRVYEVSDLLGYTRHNWAVDTYSASDRYRGSSKFQINTPFLWIKLSDNGKKKGFLADLGAEFTNAGVLDDIIEARQENQAEDRR